MTTPEADKDGFVELARLRDYLGYQIRQAQTAVFTDIEAKMKDIKVTPVEFGLLTLVGANPGISQKTLTRHYGLDKSTLSYSITRLVKKAWIERRQSLRDGRVYGLWLTGSGRDKADLATGYIEAQEDLMDTVLKPGERAQLIDLLSRISGVLRRSGA